MAVIRYTVRLATPLETRDLFTGIVPLPEVIDFIRAFALFQPFVPSLMLHLAGCEAVHEERLHADQALSPV